MALACFIHHSKYDSSWQWLTVSGTHEYMKNYMPVWSKKGTGLKSKYGQEKISLDARSVRLVRKPLGFTLELGAKIPYAVDAMREIGEIELSNPVTVKDEKTGESKQINRVYINIDTFEKRKNVLAASIERITAYASFTAPFTAAKTVFQVSVAFSQIRRDFGIKSKRISLSFTDHKQSNTKFTIEAKKITFEDMAKIFEKLGRKDLDIDETRKFFDELIRNGFAIAGACV